VKYISVPCDEAPKEKALQSAPTSNKVSFGDSPEKKHKLFVLADQKNKPNLIRELQNPT
jgi:hypothetical protein